eukprot:2766478-Prymnesium_polylepis.1
MVTVAVATVVRGSEQCAVSLGNQCPAAAKAESVRLGPCQGAAEPRLKESVRGILQTRACLVPDSDHDDVIGVRHMCERTQVRAKRLIIAADVRVETLSVEHVVARVYEDDVDTARRRFGVDGEVVDAERAVGEAGEVTVGIVITVTGRLDSVTAAG